MDPQSATRVLIEGGKSETFIAATELLAQTEAQGQRKFSKPVVKDVVRALSCRAHGPLIHQFCHLLAAAERLPDGAWDLLWGDRPGTAGQAGGWFRQRLGTGRNVGDVALSMGEDGLTITYTDASFRIALGQMPTLLALGELLISTVQFPAVDSARATVAVIGARASDVSTASNALSRSLYAYLAKHLPPTQESRIFRTILEFLEGYYGGDVDVREADDEAILKLWETHADSEGFRNLRGVVANFLRFRQTLARTADRVAFEHPDPIGTDREAGEVDPSEAHVLAREIDEASSPLDILEAPPANRVKFLNKREHADLKLLVAAGDQLSGYYLSILRAEVFGPYQRRLAQVLRSRSGRVDDVLQDLPETDYAGQDGRFRTLASHIDRVRKATLAALLKTRHEAAVPLAMQLAPTGSRQALTQALQSPAVADAAETGNVVALPTRPLAEQALDTLQDPSAVGADMAAVISETNKALSDLSRRGFRSPLDGDAFAAGEPALKDLAERLETARKAGEAFATPLDTLFAADLPRIQRRLAAIYAGGEP